MQAPNTRYLQKLFDGEMTNSERSTISPDHLCRFASLIMKLEVAPSYRINIVTTGTSLRCCIGCPGLQRGIRSQLRLYAYVSNRDSSVVQSVRVPISVVTCTIRHLNLSYRFIQHIVENYTSWCSVGLRNQSDNEQSPTNQNRMVIIRTEIV